MPDRPLRLVVVAGTGTEVGKTWAAARMIEALRGNGTSVAARKPAQSFTPGTPTDAEILADASGDAPSVVCPQHRWYEVPMAPPMAAAALGRPTFTIADLASEVTGSWPSPSVDWGLVELAGGPRSPMASDGDAADLAAALGPDLTVLVADAGLGTIIAVRLSVAVLPPPIVVLLNRYNDRVDVHVRNGAWLGDSGLTVVTDPVAAVRSR